MVSQLKGKSSQVTSRQIPAEQDADEFQGVLSSGRNR